MAYAPHTNTDIAQGADKPLLLGSFYVEGRPVVFEYAVRPPDGVDFAEDAMHIVYVGDVSGTGYRYARVLKTVAYVAIDENADGSPVWEKWSIDHHREYPTDWVRAARGWN